MYGAGSARRLQVHGFGSLAALVRLGLEGNAHALVESADVRTLDGSDMDEDVLASLVRRDEAETFRLVEELYSSGLPHARSPCPRYKMTDRDSSQAVAGGVRQSRPMSGNVRRKRTLTRLR